MNPCPKCKGSGQYRDLGKCFQCDGTGSLKPSVSFEELGKPVWRPARETRTAEEIQADQELGRRTLAKLKALLELDMDGSTPS